MAVILHMCPKPLKPCVSLRPCIYFIGLRAQKLRFVIRMITNLPSKIRQMEEFIRPLVEERLIKMEEFGETWDDAPVRRPIFFMVLFLFIVWEHRMICLCG